MVRLDLRDLRVNVDTDTASFSMGDGEHGTIATRRTIIVHLECILPDSPAAAQALRDLMDKKTSSGVGVYLKPDSERFVLPPEAVIVTGPDPALSFNTPPATTPAASSDTPTTNEEAW